MLVSTREIIDTAEEESFAVGAFNVYNLEGAVAVIRSSELENLPVILQISPTSLESVGVPLVALTVAVAKRSSMPTSVHVDHCEKQDEIDSAVSLGLRSIMADGSQLSYQRNIDFTLEAVNKIR